MVKRERLLHLFTRGGAACAIAGAMLVCLFMLMRVPVQARDFPDADAPAASSPPVTELEAAGVATWGEFTPTGWVTGSLITAAASITDSDGLQEATAQYRYSTDGGSTWFAWGQTNLIITGALTTTKRMTVTNLFLPDSASLNHIMFRIRDGAAVTETSPSYVVQVDTTAPESAVGTSGWFKALSVITGTASDATSAVAQVDIRIQRSSDSQYYNGSGWQASPVWLPALGTTAWAYSFTPSDTVTYTVESRATDNAGLVETTYGTGTIAFDSTLPTSDVGTDGYYRTATWTGAITGTASDVGSGVDYVEITLRRTNDGLYYNGSGWQGSAVWLLASGAENWSYAFAPTPGVTYEAHSRATDSVGNQQTAYGAGSFMLDVGLPTSAVETDGYYGTVTWTGYITGTASDAESDVARVEITIRRGSDNYYYNGAWWQATSVWLLTTGTGNWNYPLTPAHGETYTVQSRAEDAAGNQQTSYGSAVIVYDSGVPSSSVTTSGLLGQAGWAGQIAGLGSDDFSGLQAVDITVQRASDGLYFDGAVWAASPTWLLATGTTAWTYPFAPAEGITYTVQSRATDRAGNVQTALGTASFSYDGTPPSSTVGLSGYYGPVTWTGAITGTASDGQTAVQSVALSIERLADHLYWNGAVWQAIEVWLPATGTTEWAYGFVPAAGHSYRVRAKATDQAGNEQPSPSQATFSYDAEAPVSAVDTDGFYRFETWPGQIEGTASDGQSGVQVVEITVQRWVDNYYYNGTGWQPTTSWLAATGTLTWTYSFAPTDGMTYTVRSRAADLAGNSQGVFGSAVFCYDTQAPDSQVGTQGYYNAATWTGAITGTATDGAAGVIGVAITIQRASDARYWNGSIWQLAQTWVTTTGAVEWSYPFAADNGITYTLRSRAVDKAGNTETTYGEAFFALDLDEPDSQVGTVGFYRPTTWTGAITGTASAGVSGVDHVEITLKRHTDDYYFNGTDWQFLPEWLTATGSVDWSYPFSPTEGITYTARSRAWSGAGNQETSYGEGHFTYDGGPPVAALGTAGAYRTATWTGTITGTATDSGSGVDYVDFTLRRSTDNLYYSGISWGSTPIWLRALGTEEWSYPFIPPVEAVYSLQLRPADNAGNVQDPPMPAAFIFDNTAPFAPTEPQYFDGWKNTNVFTVTWTNAPDLSGIAGAYYKFAPPTSPTDGTFVQTTSSITDISVPDEGIWDLHLWLQDNAGNVNQNRRLVWPGMFRYDATAPTTAHDFSGPEGDNQWFLGAITVTLDAEDQPGLSGVDQRYYQVDAAGWLTTTETFQVSGDGVHDIEYYSTDFAGNVEATRAVTVGIDGVSPTVSHTVSGTLSASGWYTAPVTVILDGLDATSGVDDFDGYRYRVGEQGIWFVGKTFTVGGEGTRTFYYYALDRAGNQSDVLSGTIQVDTDPPLTTVAVSGLVGDNGWYRSSVGVTISITDATSGPEPGEIYYRVDSGAWVKGNNVAITQDGIHTVQHYGVDHAGNQGAPASTQIKVDTTPPAAPLGLDSSPATWTNVNQFSVFWTPPVDTSGISGAYYKLDAEPTFNTDGVFVPGSDRIDNISVDGPGKHSIAVWLRDGAGNTSFLNRMARINAFLYDDVTPSTNVSLDGTLGNNGWFTSPVTVTFTVQDQRDLSGPYGVAYQVDSTGWITHTGVSSASAVVSTPGKQVVLFRGLDVAGNMEEIRSVTVRLDDVPPGTPTDVLVSPQGWSRGSAFTATWKNPLPPDHSGIAAAYYKLDSPPTGPTDGTRVSILTRSIPVNVTTDGAHDIYLWLEDMAGNVDDGNYAWRPEAIRRDTQPPDASHTLIGTLGAENWYLTPVTLNFTAADALSGLASISYRVDGGAWTVGDSVLVTGDGQHTVEYKATDVAGNESTPVAVGFKIDRTAPWVSMVSAPGFQMQTTFTVSWQGTDAAPGSGVSRYDVQVADGMTGAWVDWVTNTDTTSRQYTGQPGHTYRFRARARDVAGNLGTYPSSVQLLVQVSPLANGGFDTGSFQGWTLGCTPGFNRTVLREESRWGTQSWMARLGDPVYTGDPSTWIDDNVPVGAACMSQTFTVPAASQMLAPRLTFWYHIYTWDVVLGTSGKLWDSFDVTVTPQGGQPQLVLRDGNYAEEEGTLEDLGWRYAVIDLAPYAGQTITVRFENWNRNDQYYNTWTLVDDVRVRTWLPPKVRLPVLMDGFDGTQSAASAPESVPEPLSMSNDVGERGPER